MEETREHRKMVTMSTLPPVIDGESGVTSADPSRTSALAERAGHVDPYRSASPAIHVNGHPYYVGCVIDGHTGWRGIAEVCEEALDLGWKPKGQREPRRLRYVMRRYCRNEGSTDIPCRMLDYADEAEAWLNDNTEEGFVWHWSDGEFFLSPYCGGDEDCNDETCACHV